MTTHDGEESVKQSCLTCAHCKQRITADKDDKHFYELIDAIERTRDRLYSQLEAARNEIERIKVTPGNRCNEARLVCELAEARQRAEEAESALEAAKAHQENSYNYSQELAKKLSQAEFALEAARAEIKRAYEFGNHEARERFNRGQAMLDLSKRLSEMQTQLLQARADCAALREDLAYCQEECGIEHPDFDKFTTLQFAARLALISRRVDQALSRSNPGSAILDELRIAREAIEVLMQPAGAIAENENRLHEKYSTGVSPLMQSLIDALSHEAVKTAMAHAKQAATTA